MYIIYNRDGSIKKVKLTDFINKGSDGINTINVAIDDFDLTGVTAHVQWTLPNGETVGPLILESGEPFDDDVGDHYENCFVVSIDEPETLFEGLLKGSLVLIDAHTRILYTYPIKLVINPSTFVPSSNTNITTEQYAALVEYIETNYVKGYSKTETNELLDNKADKVGPLPTYLAEPSTIIYDFVSQNNLWRKTVLLIIGTTQYIFKAIDYQPDYGEVTLINMTITARYVVATDLTQLSFGSIINSSQYRKSYLYNDDVIQNYDTFLNTSILNFINTHSSLIENGSNPGKYFTLNHTYICHIRSLVGNTYELLASIEIGLGYFAWTKTFDGSEMFNDFLSNSHYNSFELKKDKATSLSSSSTDAEYPSAKATYDFVKANATKLYEHIIYIPELSGRIHIFNNSDEPIPPEELYRADLRTNFMSRTKVINMYFEEGLINGRYYIAQFINDTAGAGFSYSTIAFISLNNMTVVKLTQTPTSQVPEVINEI